MKKAPFNMLLETASRDNTLVLTTRCSTSCVFCSHHQNPEGIEAYYVDELSRDEVNTLIEFLDGSRKVIIGESATRICEGEPFLSEGFIDILRSIRKKYKKAPIQITTSAVTLNSAELAEIREIGGVELNVSLNSSSIESRKKIYRGRAHAQALEAVAQLKHYGIPFNGSIVAMPHIVGWKDIEDSIIFLSEQGAETIRIFMPGYTKYTRGLLPPEGIREELREFIDNVRKKVKIPVLLEPAVIESLEAVVEGVIGASPAEKAGIKAGDIVVSVGGEPVASRVDAYYKLFALKDPKAELLRDGRRFSAIVQKNKNNTSGMVFNYDIHPDTIAAIERALKRNRGRRCLILTSELAYGILTRCIVSCNNIRLEPVKNAFFGGNIMCAGLLTLYDIEAHLGKDNQLPEVLLLPSIMFDAAGRDLTGRHFKEIEEGLGLIAEVV